MFLLCDEPDLRMRDIAERVGITERAVQSIISELEEAGYVSHERAGRRNLDRLQAALPMRHAIERHCRVSELLALVVKPGFRGSKPGHGRGAGRGNTRTRA